MDNDNTQSSEQTPDGSNTQPVPNPTNPTNGVQSRIDELTGTIHEQRRAMEQTNATIQELIAQNAALAARQQQQPEQRQELPEGVDPALANFLTNQFKTMLDANNRSLEQKLGQVVGTVRQSQEQLEFQQAATGADPKVVQAAQQLMATWRNKGFTGWIPADAIIYAEGQVARQGKQRTQRPNGDSNDAIQQGGAPLPPIQQSKLPPSKSDEEVNAMSLAEQEKYWGSRVGNSDLIY